MAQVWQECLEKEYGTPRIITNMHGTECDRIWKIMYDQMEITLHFYNHNKPKDKKHSKILFQGAFQSTLCEFVFTELTKIYKSVCIQKASTMTPLRESKRKRITTTVKKRNIKYKPASKLELFNCAMCDLTSSSNVKIIRHMKTMHTQGVINESIIEIEDVLPKQLVEDMSVCELSDNDDSHESLSNIVLKCEECTFSASEVGLLINHKEIEHNKHSPSDEKLLAENYDVDCNTIRTEDEEVNIENLEQDPSTSLNEETENASPLYKCKDCVFTTTTTD